MKCFRILVISAERELLQSEGLTAFVSACLPDEEKGVLNGVQYLLAGAKGEDEDIPLWFMAADGYYREQELSFKRDLQVIFISRTSQAFTWEQQQSHLRGLIPTPLTDADITMHLPIASPAEEFELQGYSVTLPDLGNQNFRQWIVGATDEEFAMHDQSAAMPLTSTIH